MNEDIKQSEIGQLKRDIAEFEAFRQSIDRQQLTFPLDKKSYDVVHKDVLVPTGNVLIPYFLVNYDDAIEIIVKGKKYLIDATSIQ